MKQRYGFLLFIILGFTMGLFAQDYPGWTLDEITVQEGEHYEGKTAVAYNIERDEFLVVWQDDRNGNSDVYGCFVSSDGSEAGEAFPICTDTTNQFSPHVDYNRIDEQYLVVWVDKRLSDYSDILGVLLDGDGRKIVPVTQKLQSDTSFVICDEDTTQRHPKVAHNFIENTFLVVWEDRRETYPDIFTKDIYAQRLDSDGGLLTPYDTPGTQVNFPIVKMDYEEYAPDVTYVPGIGDFVVNEWLVIWVQDDLNPSTFNSDIYAKRIDGETGMWLDSFGDEVALSSLSSSAAKSAASLGSYRELAISNFVNVDIRSYCGSPHVTSFIRVNFMPKLMDEMEPYPVPEVMVTWSDFRNSDPGMMNNPDIYCQRLAYFPDSTARRLGFKWLPDADTTNATVIPLDENGDWADPPIQWITWENIEVCRREDPQSYNGIGFGVNDAEYLITWNDWRATGSYNEIADIYGQRIYINPEDSALVFLDENGNVLQDKQTNIPLAIDPNADEGMHNYPAVRHGTYLNKYLITYNYDEVEAAGANSSPAQSASSPVADVHATVVSSLLPDNAVNPLPKNQLPDGFIVAQNYPNPFNPVTLIQFRLPNSEDVAIKVFDVMGREIVTLLDQQLEAGPYEVIWDSKDLNGLDVASGVYFFRIEAGDQRISRKMVLMR